MKTIDLKFPTIESLLNEEFGGLVGKGDFSAQLVPLAFGIGKRP